MSESTALYLFTVLRVVLVGGLLMVLPRITRKGLLFGAYVGEAISDTDEARRLTHRWYFGCSLLIAVALIVGLGLGAAGRPLAGDLVATAILLVGITGLYLRFHSTTKAMASPRVARQAELAVAPLETDRPRGAALAGISLVVCVLAGFGSLAYAAAAYGTLPDRVPTHFGISGEPDGWSSRSVASVMLPSALNLVLCPFLALMAWLTARAKRSIRGGTGGRSIAAQQEFRAATANLLSGIALITSAMLTFLSVQAVRVARSETHSLGNGLWWINGLLLVFVFGGLIRIMVKYGQGGARIEQGSAEAPLTDGLADNAHWVWGLFYVNRDDPSILVEKRFGLGYTINFGNWKAITLIVGFLVATLGLTVIGLIGALR